MARFSERFRRRTDPGRLLPWLRGHLPATSVRHLRTSECSDVIEQPCLSGRRGDMADGGNGSRTGGAQRGSTATPRCGEDDPAEYLKLSQTGEPAHTWPVA